LKRRVSCQLSIRIDADRIVEVCTFLRDEADTRFNYLSDLTCVHYPLGRERPMEVVYNLYSILRNDRVRLKVALAEDESVESVTGVWPTANWMEREVYDLFGVSFRNHPTCDEFCCRPIGKASAPEGLPARVCRKRVDRKTLAGDDGRATRTVGTATRRTGWRFFPCRRSG